MNHNNSYHIESKQVQACFKTIRPRRASCHASREANDGVVPLTCFKALRLFFLTNFSGPTFIPCPTFIPDSRVVGGFDRGNYSRKYGSSKWKKKRFFKKFNKPNILLWSVEQQWQNQTSKSTRRIGFSARQQRLISAGSIRLGDIEQQEQWLRFPYDKKIEVWRPLN